jgi:hypothetical protein
MKLMRLAAAVAAVVAAGSASSLASAQSFTCKTSCNTTYSQCLSGGKAQESCLAGWHQCKVGCSGAKVAAYTPARAPLAAKPAAQAKAVIGKH